MIKFTQVLVLAALCALGCSSVSAIPSSAPAHNHSEDAHAPGADERIATRFYAIDSYTVYSRITTTINLVEVDLDYSKDGFPLSESNIADAPLDPARTTVIIVHGVDGNGTITLNPDVKNAFMAIGDHDVIVVDWSQSATQTVLHFNAEGLRDVINQLVDAGKVLLSNIHLVGYGVGAHFVGQTARMFDAQTIRKITALDPANWGAYESRLRKSDARTVEAIHTDTTGTAAAGLLEPIGHIDFYPNGGTRHLGCTTNACWHERAWRFFAATITNPGVLRGNKCNDMNEMTRNSCEGIIETMGGPELFKAQEGIFRVNTGRVYPYGL